MIEAERKDRRLNRGDQVACLRRLPAPTGNARWIPSCARFSRLAAVAFISATLLGGARAAAEEPEPRHWDSQSAGQLLSYVDKLTTHGLDPSDYASADLRLAIEAGDEAKLEQRATYSFARIAADLAIGHIRPGGRGRYYIAPNRVDPAEIAKLIDVAIGTRDVSGVLDRLAPQNPQYAALRSALARLPDTEAQKRKSIEVNLERWRWLPRERGKRHLMVNIPEYTLRLFDNGRQTALHRVIVGKPQTPTPQFAAEVQAVIFNPTWTVPQSIIAESVGRLVRTSPAAARARGYTWSGSAGRLRVVQGPGPGNALGQMKLDMPNPLTVYVHDTPNKELFERIDRSFSHGCIRTQNPFDLASVLLGGTGWDRAEIDATVAGRRTTRVPLGSTVPIYVTYITAVANPDGTVHFLKDVYGYDSYLAAKL